LTQLEQSRLGQGYVEVAVCLIRSFVLFNFDVLQPHDDNAVPGGIVAFLEEFQVSHGSFRTQQRMNEKLCIPISSSLRDYIPAGSVQPNFKHYSKSTHHK